MPKARVFGLINIVNNVEKNFILNAIEIFAGKTFAQEYVQVNIITINANLISE